jgi:hypothetical protein
MSKMIENDFEFLQKLMEQYEEEAQKCKDAGALLAGSAIHAAAMEAALLAMAYCCEEEMKVSDTFRRVGEEDLRNWDLKQLLDLASEMRWLPTSLPLGKIARMSGIEPDEALKNGDVVYFADVVREVRNMIHPGRYLRLWSGVQVSKEYLDSIEETVKIVYDHLYEQLITMITGDPDFKKFSNNPN